MFKRFLAFLGIKPKQSKVQPTSAAQAAARMKRPTVHPTSHKSHRRRQESNDVSAVHHNNAHIFYDEGCPQGDRSAVSSPARGYSDDSYSGSSASSYSSSSSSDSSSSSSCD